MEDTTIFGQPIRVLVTEIKAMSVNDDDDECLVTLLLLPNYPNRERRLVCRCTDTYTRHLLMALDKQFPVTIRVSNNLWIFDVQKDPVPAQVDTPNEPC